jgi:hypothetical protein
MHPNLGGKKFVFCSISDARLSTLQLRPQLLFREKEGTTIIVEQNIAEKAKLKYKGIWALITLNVHSDLSAVGFISAISNKLAENGISVNVISAYYHDHLFVPFEQRKKALKFLKQLSSKSV